jgi:hypothetical protein
MTKLYLNTDGDWLKLNTGDDWLLLDDGSGTVTYPTAVTWQTASITSYSPTWISTTHGLVRQARSRGGHLWQIDLNYGVMTRAQFGSIWAFFNKQAGQYGVFDLDLNTQFPCRGSGGGTPLVKGASQTGTSMTTDGWTNSLTQMKAGDFFSVAGDVKVYQLTDDVVSDGSGNATMTFFPPLRRSPADNAVIDITPVFRCALTADTLATDWSQCVYAVGFTVSVVEVIT